MYIDIDNQLSRRRFNKNNDVGTYIKSVFFYI